MRQTYIAEVWSVGFHGLSRCYYRHEFKHLLTARIMSRAAAMVYDLSRTIKPPLGILWLIYGSEHVPEVIKEVRYGCTEDAK